MLFLYILAALADLALASPKPLLTPRADVSCSVRGYDKTEAYSYIGKAKYANFDACSKRCLAKSKCVSFAFGSSECLLYKKTV